MSIGISRLGFVTVLAATTAFACGSGETTQGFGEPVESYQAPPVDQENGSQPPNNLLACSPESGCQSCETPCDLCDCRYDGEQLDQNEYFLCLTAPSCVAALREYAGAAVGANNGPGAQFLDSGEQLPNGQDCAQFVDDTCQLCQCVNGENNQACDAACAAQ